MVADQLPRKLAAILYADVAGYSRLTGADEEGTHRRLSASLDLISALVRQHGGRVVHYAGDAVLADFVTASAAVRCAAQIQGELRERNQTVADAQRVSFRIGVNLGEVIVDRDDIYGNGVNVAARLQSLAEPGGICVSSSVREAVAHLLPTSFEDMGEHWVKNVAAPVHVWRVRPGPATEHSATLAPTPAAPGELRPVVALFVALSAIDAGIIDDPEAVAESSSAGLEAVAQIIGGHGGKAEHQMGDAIVGLFGLERAHGDDAERAVRAAQAIHHHLKDFTGVRALEARIGIASGRLLGRDTAAQVRPLGGSPLALAARLAHLTPPKVTLVSDAVRRAVPRLLATPAVSAELAGVRCWQVDQLLRLQPSAHRLLGRTFELAQFRSLLDASLHSRCGGCIYLRGEAGIGKTRLAEEFIAIATEREVTCHRAAAYDFGVSLGEQPLHALARSLLEVSPSDDETLVMAAVDRAIATGRVPAERRLFLIDLLHLPQSAAEGALLGAYESALRVRERAQTLAALVVGEALCRPQLVVVEDLHWAERSTLQALTALGRLVQEVPALLILTARREADPIDAGWRSAAGGAPQLTIDLGPLADPDARALATDCSAADPRMVAACVQRAGGNPLFLEHLLRNLEAGSTDLVPDSVQSLVVASLDRLAPPDRQAARAASVLGPRFSTSILRHLMGEAAGYDCGPLIEAYLVRADGEDFVFAHALVRDAIYHSLPRSTRAALHRAAAAWYASRDEVLYAEHLERAGDAAAAPAYLSAARARRDAYRTDSALELVDRGLTLAAASETQHALLAVRAECHFDLGEIQAALCAWQEAHALAPDPAARARSLTGLAAAFTVLDRLDEALAALAEAEEIASSHALDTMLARVHVLRGNVYFPLGRIDDCLREHRQALELAGASGDSRLEAEALGGLGDGEYVCGRMRTAHELFGRCVALARSLGLARIEIAHRSMHAFTGYFLGQVREARQEAIEAIQAGARIGFQRAELIAHHLGAIVAIDLAELDAAMVHVDRAQTITQTLGALHFEGENLCLRARILAYRGQRVEARQMAAEAARLSRELGSNFFGATIAGLLAELAEDDESRQRALAEGKAILNAGALGHDYVMYYRAAIEACLAASDWNGVERYAGELVSYTQSEPLTLSDFLIERGLALAAWGRGDTGRGRLQDLQQLACRAREMGLLRDLDLLELALGR
jgi:class 3 adenylate cyclase/tetratricopeptide (TPR) repeat protein